MMTLATALVIAAELAPLGSRAQVALLSAGALLAGVFHSHYLRRWRRAGLA